MVAIATPTERAPHVEPPVDGAEAERAPPEPATPEPSPAEPSRPAPRNDREAGGVEPGAPSAADRLAPRMGDPRLWLRPDGLPVPGKTGTDMARRRIAERVEEISDSVHLARESAQRMLDWTHTDDEGRLWGVAPDGKLNLGGLLGDRRPSIEIVGKTEAAQRFREWNAIRAQAGRLQVLELLSERIEAIRRRKAGEHAGTDGGSR